MPLTDQEILAELASIVEEVTGTSASQVTPGKRFAEDLEIDSLSMVEIAVIALDKLNVQIPDDKLRSFRTVQDVVGYVQSTRVLA